MKKIERLERKVFKAENDLSMAVQEFAKNVVYSDDFDEEPIISMASAGELIASLDDGRECDSSTIVQCMLEKGFVEPSDFELL